MSATILELPTAGLPEGRTAEEALVRAIAKRDFLWAQTSDEDYRIDELVNYCTRLMRGNAESGALLASVAIWS